MRCRHLCRQRNPFCLIDCNSFASFAATFKSTATSDVALLGASVGALRTHVTDELARLTRTLSVVDLSVAGAADACVSSLCLSFFPFRLTCLTHNASAGRVDRELAALRAALHVADTPTAADVGANAYRRSFCLSRRAGVVRSSVDDGVAGAAVRRDAARARVNANRLSRSQGDSRSRATVASFSLFFFFSS